ncbi:MAG TPA: hypothetical protein VHP33_29240 [Polyangiaceae bacterium]|nr:hypothetical protein [Polyangiaceae bacterium]
MRSALAVMVALVFTGACSLLIADEADEVSCEQEGRVGPPACDPGFSCQAGVCRAASSSADGDGGQAGQQGQFAAPGGGAGGALGEAGAAGAAERRH